MSKIELAKKAISQLIDNIDSETSYMSEEESIEVIDLINNLTNTSNKLSKYQACKYLNISRATFDNLVRDGKLPKGKKEQGFKELFGEMKDLKKYKYNM